MKKPAMRKPTSTTQALENSHSKRILIVEDDRSHRTMIEKILLSCGLEIDMAENGYVALSKIDAGEEYDLIIMDCDMPKLNGLQTVQAIRQREKKNHKKHTPVLAFTANQAEEDREKCMKAGMDAYLPKDIWTPQWRSILVDNLQGLIAGEFDISDIGVKKGQRPFSPQAHLSKEDPIDLEVFEQAASLLKGELEIAIEEFLEDAASYIRQIENGIKDQDLSSVAQGSHPLKSNSKSFGLMQVSWFAEEINRLSQDHQANDNLSHTQTLAQVEGFLPLLKNAFAEGERLLKQELKFRN